MQMAFFHNRDSVIEAVLVLTAIRCSCPVDRFCRNLKQSDSAGICTAQILLLLSSSWWSPGKVNQGNLSSDPTSCAAFLARRTFSTAPGPDFLAAPLLLFPPAAPLEEEAAAAVDGASLEAAPSASALIDTPSVLTESRTLEPVNRAHPPQKFSATL